MQTLANPNWLWGLEVEPVVLQENKRTEVNSVALLHLQYVTHVSTVVPSEFAMSYSSEDEPRRQTCTFPLCLYPASIVLILDLFTASRIRTSWKAKEAESLAAVTSSSGAVILKQSLGSQVSAG